MKGVFGRVKFVLLVFILAGCGAFSADTGQKEAGEESAFFITAGWNVQSLFDGQEDGNEYAEYLEKAGWTEEKYLARINVISQAVLQMIQPDKAGFSKKQVPDLIGFVELENTRVLEDLAGLTLSKHGYYWTAFASLPGSSLGIGFLSRYPLKDIKAHSITIGKETAPRPVLEVRVEPQGKPLVFLLCHWKSKLGDENATEALRRSSARVVQRRLRELKEAEAGTPVIIMGDLNENHDEFFRQSILSALLPDNPEAAALAIGSGNLDEHLVLSGKKPPLARYFPDDVPALYSPWYGELSAGSYYYRGNWETIDHFLLSDSLFDGSGWEYSGCQVLNHAPFISARGNPDTYIPQYGRGLSDHLPLLLYLNDSGS